MRQYPPLPFSSQQRDNVAVATQRDWLAPTIWGRQILLIRKGNDVDFPWLIGMRGQTLKNTN